MEQEQETGGLGVVSGLKVGTQEEKRRLKRLERERRDCGLKSIVRGSLLA